MNRDGDVDNAAANGARRAFAAISHELASPLTALHTFLRLAKGEGLGPISRCAERIQAIAEVARELATLEELPPGTTVASDLVLAIESAAARLALKVDVAAAGKQLALVGASRASMIVTALLRAVVASTEGAPIAARVERRDNQIWLRIDPGIEPTAWRVVEPWRSGTGFKLDLWAAAVAAGELGLVRVGEVNGQIAVELELPSAEPR